MAGTVVTLILHVPTKEVWMPEEPDSKPDVRRTLLLLISLVAMGLGIVLSWRGELESGRIFASASAFRIGVVLFALWLALPSLKKPAQWLPPGMAVLCLVGIMAVAAHPRLILVIAPAIGMLLTLGWVVRMFRRGPRRA